MTPIRAVAVVVPAHDEESRIDACLASIRAALQQLPAAITTAVTVVLDRCRDATPERVAAAIASWPGAVPLVVAAGSGVGAVRDAGVRDALRRLAPVPPGSIWLLHTDADTVVPPHWARAHLAYAEAGAVGVAGTVELSTGLSAHAAQRYEQLVRSRTHEGEHRHAYGANLGVRADAYLAVGGFPAVGAGEDEGVWRALRQAGHPLRHAADLRVRTSSRTTGRAQGGLAELLRGFDGCRAPASGVLNP